MSMRWQQRLWQQWLVSPFGRLTAHFLQKLVRGGQADSEFDLGAGALLGLLAAPGAFTSLLMLDKYSAFLNWMRGRLHDDLYVTSIPDKYLFLCVAMAVSGIVTVLKWDQILPDQQDYLNLAPLPVPSRRVLLANALAILAAVGVVAIDINLIPTILFPMFVTAAARSAVAAFLPFALAHAGMMFLASVFSIASVFAILGAFSAVLPRSTFRAVSPWLRGTLLIVLLALFPLGFAGPTRVRFLPPVWFLGLYQNLQGRPHVYFSQVAPLALSGLAIVFAAVVLTYALTYRRRFAEVLEGDKKPSDQPFLRLFLRIFDLFAPKTPGFARAAHQFIVRAILRSETHRLIIAVAVGLGAMAQSALAAAYLLVLGLRIAFELPAAVPANWIFRATLDPATQDTAPIARRAILAFLTTLVLVPTLAIGAYRTGPIYALVHSAYVAALSLALIELLLAGYRKLPMTCPMPGFKDNFLMLCLIQFLGFLLFTRGGAAAESWMWAAPWRYVFVPAAMWAAWRWNQKRLAEARDAGELEEGLTFENAAVRAVTRLDLSS